MSEATTWKIAGAQMDPRFGEVETNRATILARLKDAAGQGARLVVFPECALTGYCFDDRAEALPCSESITGPSVSAIASACRDLGVHAVFGFLERDGNRLFNACALVGPEGVVGSYRKVHLPYMGVDRFADPGDRPFEVFDLGGLKIGMHICYDGGFPETGRVLTLLGADLLVLPTNWPPSALCSAEHMMPTRAMENVVYAMAVNRVGEEKGFRFIGRSSVYGPSGDRLALASSDGDEILFAEIEPARARQKRQVRIAGVQEIDRIADRRPAFYSPLVAPNDRPARP